MSVGLTNYEFLLSLAGLLLASSVFVGVLLYMINLRRSSRYDEEKKKIELSLLRHDYEARMYDLSERASRDEKRWYEANHLQLEADRRISNSENEARGIVLNSFLRSAGITEADLVRENFVFVITPFHSKYDDVFETIKSVCSQAGIKCIRGDEQNFKSDIFTHIVKNIIKARVVIANLSGRNPNVMYELGIAHMLDKDTIMLSKLIDELPVDIKSKRIVAYKDQNDLSDSLKIELLKILSK